MFRDPFEGLFVEEDTIVHYGVKGQKWGVRRKLNTAGSRVKKAAKRQADFQLGRTPEQKAARAKAKTQLKSAGAKAKEVGKKQLDFQLGRSPEQKAARAKAKADIKKAGEKAKEVKAKVKAQYNQKVTSLAKPENEMKLVLGTAAVTSAIGAFGTVALWKMAN